MSQKYTKFTLPLRPLNNQQKLFCKIYVSNGRKNQTHAAIEAKYSEKTAYSIGHELLKKPEIKEYIKELSQETDEKLGISAYWVKEKLKICIEVSLVEIEGKYQLINHKALLGATDQLNKMCGFYALPKQESPNTYDDADLETAKELTKQYRRDH